MNTTQRILVFGATGLIGSVVARRLQREGFTVRVFSRNIQKAKQLLGERFEYHQGDVLDQREVEAALNGCQLVHISVGKVDEFEAVKTILESTKRQTLQKISYTSGDTVCEDNSWFPMIQQKYMAEKLLQKSTVPAVIFRPAWFFESLALMVEKGRASVLGKQPHAYHWLAASDFATMVVKAHQTSQADNKILHARGPEAIVMKTALEKYCQVYHPKIKKVQEVPFGIISLIAFLSRNKELKQAIAVFKYFSKTTERKNVPSATATLLPKQALMTLEAWLRHPTASSASFREDVTPV